MPKKSQTLTHALIIKVIVATWVQSAAAATATAVSAAAAAATTVAAVKCTVKL